MRRQIERDGSRADLLIVEDNPGDARLFREYLAEADIDNPVHNVSSVADALDFVYQRGDYASEPTPDVVFIDWHLPRGTGDEIVEHLNEEPETVDAFTVVLTGSRRRQDSVVPSELGVDGYLTKPIDTDEFLDLVEAAEELSLAPADD
jgi:CheY-like chemotaxis protein